MTKPILCLDFDGVLHSYTSGWKRADIIPDPPVDGALPLILKAMRSFDVQIFSSRSNQPGVRSAMIEWLNDTLMDELHLSRTEANNITEAIGFPTEKPPALVTIDDRAICFTGVFPLIDELKAFKPWNKR